jgi:hypothetical protein
MGLARVCKRPLGQGNTSSGIEFGGRDFGRFSPFRHDQIFYDDGSNMGYFAEGILPDAPGNRGQYRDCRYLGPDDEVRAAVDYLGPRYTPETYNPLGNNCQDFIRDVENTINPIPEY